MKNIIKRLGKIKHTSKIDNTLASPKHEVIPNRIIHINSFFEMIWLIHHYFTTLNRSKNKSKVELHVFWKCFFWWSKEVALIARDWFELFLSIIFSLRRYHYSPLTEAWMNLISPSIASTTIPTWFICLRPFVLKKIKSPFEHLRY
jgi:hypothetical protein